MVPELPLRTKIKELVSVNQPTHPRIAVLGPGAIGTTVAAALHEVGRTPLLCGRTPRDSLTLHGSGLRIVVPGPVRDRKSTRLNSSHLVISYAVFCLKKKIVSVCRGGGRRGDGDRRCGRSVGWRTGEGVGVQRGHYARYGSGRQGYVCAGSERVHTQF